MLDEAVAVTYSYDGTETDVEFPVQGQHVLEPNHTLHILKEYLYEDWLHILSLMIYICVCSI